VYHNEWAGKLAELLVTLTQREGGLGYAAGTHAPPSEQPAADAATPAGGPGAKVFFANTGAEANEGALKIARKVGKDRGGAEKTGIVCFENAFHGRTMGALSVTANAKYQQPFEPLLPGVKVGKLNNYELLETLIDDATCAVIVEPIQGEGGCTAAEVDWLRALRKKCDETGAVLIFDEVQVCHARFDIGPVLTRACFVFVVRAVPERDDVGALGAADQLPPGRGHDGQAARERLPNRRGPNARRDRADDDSRSVRWQCFPCAADGG
jgi:hypothetical protein